MYIIFKYQYRATYEFINMCIYVTAICVHDMFQFINMPITCKSAYINMPYVSLFHCSKK